MCNGLEINYYIRTDIDSSNGTFYPLGAGILKISLHRKNPYYSGSYFGTEEIFRDKISENRYMLFEGVYKKNTALYDFFIKSYFGQNKSKVGVACEYNGSVYYSEGFLEIRMLESSPLELKTEAVVFFEKKWFTGTLSDIVSV